MDNFVLRHVDNIGVTSVRVCCHFRKGGEPISLAEVDAISHGSLEFPDPSFGLSIGLVVARRSHHVLETHLLKSLFPELGSKSGISITHD